MSVDFKKLAKLGIKPHHFVEALGISRVTASKWFNGHTSPHVLLLYRLGIFEEAIKSAIKAKDLPAPVYLPPRERAAHVNAILKKHHAKVKENYYA